MPELYLREITYNSPAYAQTVALRHEILRVPLGLKFPRDELKIEGAYFHLACFQDDELAACLVLVPVDDSEIKMRQVAVADKFQRRGVGRALVEFSEQVARECGFEIMTLHARETAVIFYEKLGYEKRGAAFEEVTLRHWAMSKEL